MKFYIIQSDSCAKFDCVITATVIYQIITITYVKDKGFVAAVFIFKVIITSSAN